jgi:hypothetical protein
MPITYYGRKREKGGFEYLVAITEQGCFITDPVEEWEKDNDYLEEAQTNTQQYTLLEKSQAANLLKSWNRPLLEDL